MKAQASPVALLPFPYFCPKQQPQHGKMADSPITLPQEIGHPLSLAHWKLEGSVLTAFSSNGVQLRIEAITDSILRLRYAPYGHFRDDFSYAIAEHFSPTSPAFALVENTDGLQLKTAGLQVSLQSERLMLSISDAEGNLLSADGAGFKWEENVAFGGETVKLEKAILAGEQFFGLGDKTGSADLRGRTFSLWGTDRYAYGNDADPLYKNIPFFIGVRGGKAYGIFFDNSFKSYFDFGATAANRLAFSADGGELNYYFFTGESAASVVAQYTLLTGLPELPPLWALGYHQCRWSYFPQARVEGIAATFRDMQIPCDAIYLDIDYMNDYRCFTWDTARFPNPKAMVEGLSETGFKTIAIIDPGIKIDPDYPVYQEAVEKGYFCRRGDGAFMRGPVWPGYCHFPDFTHPEVRRWWAGLFAELVEEIGIAGVWNDMNEPAIFLMDNFVQCDRTFPDDVRHDYDGNPCSHRKAHNVYGMQMSRATYEGVKSYRKDKRPFTITRSTYSGGQRFASTWTGDNVASWEHLRIANLQCQRLSISGMGFVGSDIGGFIDTPDGELFIRWLQLGIFHPFCRTHSSKDFGDQEPWTWGEPYTSLARFFISLRYRLLPYFYTVFYDYAQSGKPMLMPIGLVYSNDREALRREEEFLVGEHLLVRPVTQARAEGAWVYLPDGVWYNYFSGETQTGGQEHWCKAPLDVVPLFAKAGSIIPHFPVRQYVGELPIKMVTLHLYYGSGTVISQWYEDENDGYGYQQGKYLLHRFESKGGEKEWLIEQSCEGLFASEVKVFEVITYGCPFFIDAVYADGEQVANSGELFVLPADFKTLRLSSKE